MSDLASLLRFAQQNAQTPQPNINPAAGLGSGSLSGAYQKIMAAQPPALYQPTFMPVPPPQMATVTPLSSDDGANPLFQPQYLPEPPPAPFQGPSPAKGGPILSGAGPSASSGSVTTALARTGLLGG